jgi:iron complex outermembrane receptor protein
MSALLLASLLAVAAPLPAAAQEVHAFNVSTTDPASAIRAFGVQAGLQILASADDLRGKKLNPVSGEFSTEQALNDLLAGTGLDHRYVSDRAVALVSDSIAVGGEQHQTPQGEKDKSTAGTDDAKKGLSNRFLLAQATPGQAASDVSVEKKKEQASKKKEAEELQVVIVTGSRIPTTAGSEVQPVRSYTREDIDNSGQTTLGEFLNTLPDVSNFTQSSYQLGHAGIQTVQLHGLPIGTTLTLLDGLRVETSSLGLFDLSNVPVSAVERIEVLPVGSSAIYGADALAGAVNIILRKNLNGFEVNATLDHAPNVNNPGVNLAWGKSGERGSVSMIASYEERGQLLGAEREPTSLNRFPINAPASTVLALGSDTCDPGNVYSVDGSNLPGLSSPQAGIPTGIRGMPTLQQFAPTAGKLNVCSLQRYGDITPWSQRESALLSAHYEFAESADLFTETLLSQIGVEKYIAISTVGVTGFEPATPTSRRVARRGARRQGDQRELRAAGLLRSAGH